MMSQALGQRCGRKWHGPRALAAVATFALMPGIAHAADDDSLCVDRPGLNTPTCTLPTGRVMVELGLVGWDHTTDAASREDDIALGDTLARFGIGSATEVQVGFGGWNHQRNRDIATGRVSTANGAGDVSIGLRHGFGTADDAPVAIQATVTLPWGSGPASASTWGASLIVPVTVPLPAGLSLSASPELDAAPNESGHGRHLAWGGAVGVSGALAPRLSLTAEVGAWRDDDPLGHSTDARAALSLAWQAGRSWQIDVELDKGLASGAPDHALMIGCARQF